MLLMLFVLFVIPFHSILYIPAGKLRYLFNALIMKRPNGVKMLQKVSLINSSSIYVLHISVSLTLFSYPWASKSNHTLSIEHEANFALFFEKKLL